MNIFIKKKGFIFIFKSKDAIRTEYAPIIDPIESGLDEKYAQLERQHAEFSVHVQTQINQIQQQIVQLHQVQQQTPPPPPHLLNNTFGIFRFISFENKSQTISLGPPLPPNMLPRMPLPSQSNNPNQQPPPLMSLNPFTENARDNSSQ